MYFVTKYNGSVEIVIFAATKACLIAASMGVNLVSWHWQLLQLSSFPLFFFAVFEIPSNEICRPDGVEVLDPFNVVAES